MDWCSNNQIFLTRTKIFLYTHEWICVFNFEFKIKLNNDRIKRVSVFLKQILQSLLNSI